MRIQISLELLVSMLIALAIALSLSWLAVREGAVLASNSNTIAAISGSVNSDYRMLLSLAAHASGPVEK